MRRNLKRLLSGSAVALLAAAVVSVPGTPALAAGPAARLHFPGLSVAAGSENKLGLVHTWIDVPGTKPAVAHKVTVSVDTADVDDIATVTVDEERGVRCDQTGTVITCETLDEIELHPGTNLAGVVVLAVAGKRGAAVGADGQLAFTARIDDGPAVPFRSTVAIGEKVDLGGSFGGRVTVNPGTSVAATMRVTNYGPHPAKGAVLELGNANPKLIVGETFSNCTYGRLLICTFKEELAADTTYTLSTPIHVKLPADAAVGSSFTLLGGWYTPSDFKEELDSGYDLGDLIGKKGTGGPVSLRAVPKGKGVRAAGQVDPYPGNNLQDNIFNVGGKRRPDMAAIGATVTGDVGDKVRTKLGYVNNGPGVLYHDIFQNVDPYAHILVPAGLSVAHADGRCSATHVEAASGLGDQEKSAKGAHEYVCRTTSGKTGVGKASLFDFTFEVRDNASADAGEVRINENPFHQQFRIVDRDPSNDKSKITVQDSSGGSGGGLPITGANAGQLGAAGGVLLLAGVLGLMLVRRRRLRFTA